MIVKCVYVCYYIKRGQYPESIGFFLTWLLAFVKSFAWLVSHDLEALYVIVAYNKKNLLPAFQKAIIHVHAALSASIFKTRPSQLHLHLLQREMTYT